MKVVQVQVTPDAVAETTIVCSPREGYEIIWQRLPWVDRPVVMLVTAGHYELDGECWADEFADTIDEARVWAESGCWADSIDDEEEIFEDE